MKRLLTLIIAAIALQACSMTRPDYQYPPSYGYGSTYGYDTPVSPVHISINIDKQPVWGPVGYDCAAYYYMPELNVYYDVNLSLFYYPSGSSWISAQYLPPAYRVYDLFRTYKVVLNYASPWQHNDNHRSQYRHYRDDRSQITIRMSRDPRYDKSWENTRPWIDPNRRSNRKSDYRPYPQAQPSSSDRYIEQNKNNNSGYNSGYRTESPKNAGNVAGGPYRTQDPNDGVSSRGKARKQSNTSNEVKYTSPKSNTRSTDTTSPSESYRSTNSSTSNTTTRGR